MSTAAGRYAIICHDDRAMISGEFLDLDNAGCEVITSDRSTYPVFRMGAPVVLNILDERQNASVNVVARAVDVRRIDESWVYSFSWKQIPAFLAYGPAKKPRTARSTRSPRASGMEETTEGA